MKMQGKAMKSNEKVWNLQYLCEARGVVQGLGSDLYFGECFTILLKVEGVVVRRGGGGCAMTLLGWSRLIFCRMFQDILEK